MIRFSIHFFQYSDRAQLDASLGNCSNEPTGPSLDLTPSVTSRTEEEPAFAHRQGKQILRSAGIAESDDIQTETGSKYAAQNGIDNVSYPALKKLILDKYLRQELQGGSEADNTCNVDQRCFRDASFKSEYPVLKKRILSSAAADVLGQLCSDTQPAAAAAAVRRAEPVVKRKKVITLEEYRRRRAQAKVSHTKPGQDSSDASDATESVVKDRDDYSFCHYKKVVLKRACPERAEVSSSHSEHHQLFSTNVDILQPKAHSAVKQPTDVVTPTLVSDIKKPAKIERRRASCTCHTAVDFNQKLLERNYSIDEALEMTGTFDESSTEHFPTHHRAVHLRGNLKFKLR